MIYRARARVSAPPLVKAIAAQNADDLHDMQPHESGQSGRFTLLMYRQALGVIYMNIHRHSVKAQSDLHK